MNLLDRNDIRRTMKKLVGKIEHPMNEVRIPAGTMLRQMRIALDTKNLSAIAAEFRPLIWGRHPE